MAGPSRPRRAALLAGLLASGVLTGCARSPRSLLASPPRAATVEELLAAHPLPPGENIRAAELARGESASLHLVRIRDREKPHVHTRYDLTVTLLGGEGTLWLDGKALPMRAGDVAFVPRGTPHYFVNEGCKPAAALVSFSPPFDGPDQEGLNAGR
jgi:quercetin dioxygenase-like cupin family protein